MHLEPTEEDDASLVARCRVGDASAWRTLVGRYQRLVYAIARRVGFDDHAAADVFQTVFVRLHEALPRLQQPERLQAWIVTTARRESLLQLRRAKRTVSLAPAGEATADGGADDVAGFDPVDEALLPDEQLEQLQELHRVRRALDALDERCRRLLLLLFDDGPAGGGYEQVGAELGMPVGSIGPTRARCLDKLRRQVTA